jgi:hypothetical protein
VSRSRGGLMLFVLTMTLLVSPTLFVGHEVGVWL